MIALERMDWENVKRQSTEQIRAALINIEVGTDLLNRAEKELLKFPKEEKK